MAGMNRKILIIDDDGLYRTHYTELLTDEAHAELRLLEANSRSSELVGAYLADAKATPQGTAPTHFREVFRMRGPSNYAHGKQAR